MKPMSMPPMSMPPMQQQQQHRFFHNNNNNSFNNSFNQQNRFRPSHYNQQRPTQVQPPQQAPAPGPNPFIPLQASRKATKTKNNQPEPKKLPQQKPVVEQHQEVKEPATSQIGTSFNTSFNQPAVDNRKCRLAISFGK